MGLRNWWRGREATRENPENGVERADGLQLKTLHSLSEFQRFHSENKAELERRKRLEKRLIESDQAFEVEGFCHLCQAPSSFKVTYAFSYEDDGVLVPNWREHLNCEHCGLNNRMRASLHLLDALIQPSADASIYLTEQHSAVFDHLAERHAEVIGSEFLRDGTACGETNDAGFRHENLTRLSFAAERFDAVVSFDVLEHVPDYRSALRECARVLRPGGALLLSVPFRSDSEDHLVRARLADDGTVEHLMEPEYHGDPLDPEGCLAFYQFGWRLLDEMLELGFSRSAAHLYWSREYAYLGGSQLIFTAWK